MKHFFAAALLLTTVSVYADNTRTPSRSWNPDKGTHYINPVLNADYSDPDVCRVGEDFYMTSSSFGCFLGLQILHSTDLVNWEIIGAALTDYPGTGWSDNTPWETLGQRLSDTITASSTSTAEIRAEAYSW